MPHPFLEDAARVLLVVHALAAIVTLGSSGHLGVLGVLLLVRKRAPAGLIRMHAKVCALAYGVTYGVGLLIYPSFRVLVRGLFLDRYEPWASNLFDFKENLAALGLPFALALFFLGRRLRAMPERATALFFAVGSVSLAALCIVVAVSGLVVTSVKGP